MKFESELGSRRIHRLGLVLTLVMAAAFAYLAYGSGFDNEFAGIGALVALPFCAGALVTLSARGYSPLGCLVAPVALGVISMALVRLGLEGMVCVAMVMPIWFLAGLGGGLTALYRASRSTVEGEGGSKLNSVGLALLPFLLIYAEGQFPAPWQSREVSRSIVLDAGANQVWPLLTSIPDVGSGEGKPTFTHDWLSIPRPTDARIVQRGDMVVREARWGDDIRFDEIVTRQVAERRIDWRFDFPDSSLQDHTDRHISPDGEMLKIEEGRYELEALADGRTLVTLTTRYRMRTRLDWYLGWWGERLLGDVQENVLAIIAGRVASVT